MKKIFLAISKMALFIAVVGGVYGYYFTDLEFDYGLLCFVELLILSFVSYVAYKIDDILDFVTKLYRGE